MTAYIHGDPAKLYRIGLGGSDNTFTSTASPDVRGKDSGN